MPNASNAQEPPAQASPRGRRAEPRSPGATPKEEGASGSPAGAPAHGPSAAGAQAGAGAPKTVSQVLGEIVWLMSQSPRHKQVAIGELEWLVMPAILLKQFRVFYGKDRPVGVVLWALASEAVAARIESGEKRLSAAEWRSGSRLRIVDLVAPFGGEEEMRRQVEAPADKLQ
jgi:cytolysin-activating lysine-acyltransferase